MASEWRSEHCYALGVAMVWGVRSGETVCWPAVCAAALALLGGCAIDARETRASGPSLPGPNPAEMSRPNAAGSQNAGGSENAVGAAATPLPGDAASGNAASGDGSMPVAATLSAEPALDLGAAEVAQSGNTLIWTVERRGAITQALPVLTHSNAADFEVIGDCATLGTQGSCALSVQFTPQTGGVRTSRLELALEDGRIGVDLTGNAQVRLTLVRAGGGQGSIRSAMSDAIDCGERCTALFDAGARIALDASTRNGDGSFLSAWQGAECEGPSQRCTVLMDATKTVEATFSPMRENLVFVSSEPYAPNLGGVAPYDAACNEQASAAGINDATGDAYFAGMGGAGVSLRDRLLAAPVTGWTRLDGLPFALDVDSLFDGQILHPVRYTERGETRSVSVMIGADSDGSDNGANCDAWSSATADATLLAGSSVGGPYTWQISYAGGCDFSPLHLLCFGRNGTAPPAPIRRTGKLIWLSDEEFLPGSGSPDEVCQRSMPAGVSSALAFLATTERAAAAVLDPAALYVRPDGQAVGTGEQLALRQPLTGIWQLADGSYVTFEQGFTTWTGHSERTEPGQATSNCDNWQSTSGSGWVGFATAAGDDFWFIGSQPCAAANHLYCVEP